MNWRHSFARKREVHKNGENFSDNLGNEPVCRSCDSDSGNLLKSSGETLAMCSENGFMAMINIPVWMFLSSYEKLRNNILSQNSYVNMLHYGSSKVGESMLPNKRISLKFQEHLWRIG